MYSMAVTIVYPLMHYHHGIPGLQKGSRIMVYMYYSLQISDFTDLRVGEGTWLCHYIN
jgi:hypothetical protein